MSASKTPRKKPVAVPDEPTPLERELSGQVQELVTRLEVAERKAGLAEGAAQDERKKHAVTLYRLSLAERELQLLKEVQDGTVADSTS